MTCLRKIFFGNLCMGLAIVAGAGLSRASEVTSRDLDELLTQNHNLQREVQKQQQQIDELRHRLDEVQNKEIVKNPDHNPVAPEPAVPVRLESPVLRAGREIRVSGEVGLGFFSSGRDGAFPNAEFRVDEARIFLEAPVWKKVYFFTGMELATRESRESNLHLGELYADIEDVLAGGHNQRLNLRLGRFNIPFGEEYQSRNVMMNPLITHSVADIWGIDEGIQIYGTLGSFQYNLAVQNGGADTRRDYNKDKSVTARLSVEPVKSLHLSVSAHRTGKLDVAKDISSEIWFGGEYLGPLGAPATTQTFQASFFELDAEWHWSAGHVTATAGAMRVDDDRPATNDARTARFHSIEIVHQISPKFYGAARFGEISIAQGYPLVGLGNYAKFYYASPPTKNLQRLSLGLGYRFAEPLIWKMEYSWETGDFITGVSRNNDDMFSTEIGLKF